jgi:glucose/arabinose dehydrogenase
VLGERAAIVAGLPLPMVGDAALAIDAAGRIYVAMPAAPSSDPRAARYAGMVLRFESDGSTVGDDGADAPVLSRGYAQPTALAWSGAGDDLWLAGTDAEWTGTLARLPLNRASAGPAAVPESVSLPAGSTAVSLSALEPTAGPTPDTAAEAAVFVVDEAGGVSQVTASPDGMTTTPWIAADQLGGRIVAVSQGAAGELLLVVTTGEPAAVSSQIIRLRRE